jgi:hypothetical protein
LSKKYEIRRATARYFSVELFELPLGSIARARSDLQGLEGVKKVFGSKASPRKFIVDMSEGASSTKAAVAKLKAEMERVLDKHC